MEGLSILIPVYNHPVEALVSELSAQLTRINLNGEIIILDDGSETPVIQKNNKLGNLHLVKVFHNSSNLGRLKTRLKLAEFAAYPFLLFIDADSGIIREDFLANYFDAIKNGVQLVTGGRVYQKHTPSCEFMLHWKYGAERESFKTNKTAFISNNFLVNKDLFLKLDHTVKLKNYGHEDTWWGIQFEKSGTLIKYIDNPVLHLSLETSVRFLKKSEEALQNLIDLRELVPETTLAKHVRIYRVYRRLKKYGLLRIFLILNKRKLEKLKRNILSCNPNLRSFDLYRLIQFAVMQKQGS